MIQKRSLQGLGTAGNLAHGLIFFIFAQITTYVPTVRNTRLADLCGENSNLCKNKKTSKLCTSKYVCTYNNLLGSTHDCHNSWNEFTKMVDHGPVPLRPCLGNTTIDRTIYWRYIAFFNIINKLTFFDFFARLLVWKNKPTKISGNFAAGDQLSHRRQWFCNFCKTTTWQSATEIDKCFFKYIWSNFLLLEWHHVVAWKKIQLPNFVTYFCGVMDTLMEKDWAEVLGKVVTFDNYLW